jgi:hypothetical protein
MSGYIHFTPEQKEQARMTDLVDLLRRNGETLKRSGSEYQWGEGSNKVTIRGNTWYHQYDQRGGDAIDFVQRFYRKSFPDAVQYLLSQNGITITPAQQQQRQTKEEKVFTLPPRNDNMRRVYAYLLHHRKLDRDVINAFAHRNFIYESADTHNVVFVGCDRNGHPRHAQKRSTASQGNYKGNVAGSQMEHAFHWHGSSEYVFLFEAPIDMLSFISMTKDGWQQHSYAAACSVTDKVLFQMMKDNPHIKYVFICFDNDEAGQSAGLSLCGKLTGMNIPSSILTPRCKDWNEDLVQSLDEAEKAGMQQTM